MVEIAETEDKVYSQKWLKTKLKERHGEHINFVEECKPNKVCFCDMVDFLINDKWRHDRMSSTKDEAERIIAMAAKIVLDDIRSASFDCE